LTPTEKQAELEKHKSIIDATLDYLLLHDTGKFVFDGIDRDKKSYKDQKVKAEKHFNSSKLEKLENQLQGLTQALKLKPDVDFRNYIIKTTGYDFDMFAEHRKGYEEVLAKGRIDTNKECHDFCIMIAQEITDETQLEEMYGPLFDDFYQRQMEVIEASPELKKKYDEEHEIIEKDGELLEVFYSGGKPSHSKNREEIAPDGKRKIRISERTHHEHSSTSIDLNIGNYGCSLYSVDGIYPEINAFWKDNHTIVIETKGHASYTKYQKIEIFGHPMNIEYIET
jgi:hypothetical protein